MFYFLYCIINIYLQCLYQQFKLFDNKYTMNGGNPSFF